MKFEYDVKHNGKWYKSGTDVPIDGKKAEPNKPSAKPTKTVKGDK